MIRLENPQALIKELENYGVTLQPHIEYDPQSPLLEIQAQFNGEEYSPMGAEADFGGLFSFLSPKKHLGKIASKATGQKITVKKIDVKKSLAGTAAVGFKAAAYIPGLSKLSSVGNKLSSVAKTAKKAMPVKAVSSFAVSAKALNSGGLKASLGAADKLLGSKKISVTAKQKIINNTKAMAALGDKDAKNGLLVLNAARKIRVVNKVPPGKPAVTKANTSIKPAPVATVKKEFSKSQVLQLAQNATITTKLGWWPRFKIWIGIKA